MKYTVKKITALLLALMMVLSMTPLSVLAEETGEGEGTQIVRDASPIQQTMLRGTDPAQLSVDIKKDGAELLDADLQDSASGYAYYLLATNNQGAVQAYLKINSDNNNWNPTNDSFSLTGDTPVYVVRTSNNSFTNTSISNFANSYIALSQTERVAGKLGDYRLEETFDERKEQDNARQYRQWLSCGFKGEMHINDAGWCDNGLSLSDHEDAKRIDLFDKYPFRAHIEYMQLPNKKWIVGSWLDCPLHGYCHGISVWSKQYDTESEAISAELAKIEKSLEERDKKKFVLDALQTCRNNYKESLFEMAFAPAAQFEQVTLF